VPRSERRRSAVHTWETADGPICCLDVSQKLTSICVVDDGGRRLWRGQCHSEPEPIERAVRRHAGDDAGIGIETGPMTPWLVHELRKRGLDVVCLDARHASAALKMQMNKTDQNDAEGLAQIMRTGWYRSVHVKSLDAHRTAALLAAVIAAVACMLTFAFVRSEDTAPVPIAMRTGRRSPRWAAAALPCAGAAAHRPTKLSPCPPHRCCRRPRAGSWHASGYQRFPDHAFRAPWLGSGPAENHPKRS
jgi:hypothetical protein